MNSKDYQAAAIRTESVPARLDINELGFHAMMTVMIAASDIADLVKRKLYYGKDIPHADLTDKLNAAGTMCAHLATQAEYEPGKINARLSGAERDERDELVELPEEIKGMDLDNLNIRLLHASLGMFSESGEQLKALLAQYETGVLDKVNMLEETGDCMWYEAIACDELGADMDAVRDQNIAKLRARFPTKFTTEAALNRDLDGERAILEQVA